MRGRGATVGDEEADLAAKEEQSGGMEGGEAGDGGGALLVALASELKAVNYQ